MEWDYADGGEEVTGNLRFENLRFEKRTLREIWDLGFET
jgi:hypothetical protein